jgi:glycosyltransferase involved in cell wall biosynthesis
MPGDRELRVLVLTPEWPSEAHPGAGTFVVHQVDSLRARNVVVDVMQFRGGASPRRYWRAHADFLDKIRAGRYDLVHAHFGQAGFIAVMQKKLPVVVTFHGSDVFGLPRSSVSAVAKGGVLRLVSRVAASRAQKVIAVSRRVAGRISRADVDIIPMAVSAHFHPLDPADSRAELRWPSDETSVLFVGDPRNEIKRFALAEAAVRLLAEQMPNVRLRVCWNEEIARVPVYMNAADVLLITSRHEGGPLVLSEALACGLPVVSVDVGIVRERLSGVQGCVVLANDRPETIAGALRTVLERGGRLILASSSQDGPDFVAARVEDVYRKALNEREHRR